MARSIERRTLLATCLAHVLHDGYTDLTYVLLPIWQAELGIGYALLATLRGLYAASTAILQVSAGRAAQRFGARRLLVLGTVVAGLGYICAGRSGGIVGLCIGLVISGAGARVALAFIGGAAGKLACSWLGQRIGGARHGHRHRGRHRRGQRGSALSPAPSDAGALAAARECREPSEFPIAWLPPVALR